MVKKKINPILLIGIVVVAILLLKGYDSETESVVSIDSSLISYAPAGEGLSTFAQRQKTEDVSLFSVIGLMAAIDWEGERYGCKSLPYDSTMRITADAGGKVCYTNPESRPITMEVYYLPGWINVITSGQTYLKLVPEQKGCRYGLNPGQEYAIELYLCDQLEGPLCHDSDGGTDIMETGYITNIGGTLLFTDRCLSGTIIQEGFCEEGYPDTIEMDCADLGYATCTNGACGGFQEGWIGSKFCKDNDVYQQKQHSDGSITDEKRQECPDDCQDGVCVEEKECESHSDCTPLFGEGYICANNRCIPSGKECVDSDGGKDWQKKGTTSYLGESSEDKCRSDDITLVEYHCDSYDRPQFTEHTCPYGCCEGRCLNQGETCGDDDDDPRESKGYYIDKTGICKRTDKEALVEYSSNEECVEGGGRDGYTHQFENIVFQKKLPPNHKVGVIFEIVKIGKKQDVMDQKMELVYSKQDSIYAQDLIKRSEAEGYLFSFLGREHIDLGNPCAADTGQAFVVDIVKPALTFRANPTTPTEEGTYILAIGSYEECYPDGEGYTSMLIMKDIVITEDAKPKDEICDNRLDDDFNGLIDLDDRACEDEKNGGDLPRGAPCSNSAECESLCCMMDPLVGASLCQVSPACTTVECTTDAECPSLHECKANHCSLLDKADRDSISTSLAESLEWDEIDEVTTVDLLPAVCYYKADKTHERGCEEEAKCKSLQSIIKAGYISEDESTDILIDLEKGMSSIESYRSQFTGISGGLNFNWMIAASGLHSSFTEQSDRTQRRNVALCVIPKGDFELSVWLDSQGIPQWAFWGGIGLLAVILILTMMPKKRRT